MKTRTKILMVGLGAIGQRHARNFRALLGDQLELLAFRSRRSAPVLNDKMEAVAGDPAESLGARVFSTMESALAEKPHAVVISNPSSLHLQTARVAVEAGCAVFIEKPLSHTWHGVQDFLELVERKKVVTFVAYQWRFHPLLQSLKRLLDERPFGRVVSVQASYGEYLPGWHPYEDYRQSYAARAELGGGVLLTQIHDFDYLGWLLGWPKQVYTVGGHVSDLEIDVEDVADTVCCCEVDGRFIPVHIHQDYLQKPGTRRCEFVAERGRIEVDLIGATLKAIDTTGKVVHEENFSAFVRNEMFLAEARHFLECLDGGTESLIPAMEGARSLAVALAAKKSLLSGQQQVVVSVK